MTDEKRIKEIKEKDQSMFPREDIYFLIDLVERLKFINKSLIDNDRAWIEKMKQLQPKIQRLEKVEKEYREANIALAGELAELKVKNQSLGKVVEEAERVASKIKEGYEVEFHDLQKAIINLKVGETMVLRKVIKKCEHLIDTQKINQPVELFKSGYAINGCCSGGCCVITGILYCPFCGEKLEVKK